MGKAELIIDSKIRKNGESLYLLMPKQLVSRAVLEDGMEVRITYENGIIKIENLR